MVTKFLSSRCITVFDLDNLNLDNYTCIFQELHNYLHSKKTRYIMDNTGKGNDSGKNDSTDAYSFASR